MKIAMVSNTLSSIFLFRLPLIVKLKEKKHQVIILIPKQELSGIEVERISQLDLTVLFYHASRTSVNPLREMTTLFSLYSVIKRERPDVVFSFFPKPIIFGSLAAKLAGIKRIVAMFEGLGYCFTKRKMNDSFKKTMLKNIQVALYKLSLRYNDVVLFLNKDDACELVEGNKVKIINYRVVGGIGVDLNKYQYKEDKENGTNGLTFTMVSRLLIDKGIQEFISAAKAVKQHHPETTFQIVGGIDDNLGGISEQELKELKVNNIVTFIGKSDDVKTILENSDVFVLPSYREGVPRSTQEALAVGLPVITTDVPGCRETVINGVNGFLVPPWDVDELTSKILHLIDNPDVLTKMGLQSRLLAEEKFNENDFCDTVESILTNSNEN